ncbi:MAG: type III pantothenate kinase [Mycoplasmoidaceae bacterium]|nr:type III pantothenate kinase [Mycoplasmoidaceae bacterium]
MELINNYLVLDFGNSCIKAAVFRKSINKVIESKVVSNTTSAEELMQQFDMLNDQTRIHKVIIGATARPELTEPFIADLKRILNVEIKKVEQEDFYHLLDLSNINREVKVGVDILSSVYYASKLMHRGVVVSLGSIYYCVYFDNKRIGNVMFTPSLVKGLKYVSKYGKIDKESIPEKFDKTLGLNTKDAFASGLNLIIEAAIDGCVRIFGLTTDHIILSGGDAPKFANAMIKYRYDNFIVVNGLITLLKERS